MARIRSIKPEFATDGDMLKLSDSCALFFILMWGHCDDEGKHRADYRQLAAELGGRWDQGKVKLFVSRLVKSGQLRLSSCSAWLQVTGWSHQKIDKPRQPAVKAEDLEWLSTEASAKLLESSSNIRRKDRRGEDTRGEERISSGGVQAPPPAPVEILPRKAKTAETWVAYSEAYRARYGTDPVRNATVNGQFANLVKRLGEEEAPLVAAFYLTHNDGFYVKSMHPVGLLLKDAEKLRTEWATGRRMTQATARQVDRSQHNFEVLKALKEGFGEGGSGG